MIWDKVTFFLYFVPAAGGGSWHSSVPPVHSLLCCESCPGKLGRKPSRWQQCKQIGGMVWSWKICQILPNPSAYIYTHQSQRLDQERLLSAVWWFSNTVLAVPLWVTLGNHNHKGSGWATNVGTRRPAIKCILPSMGPWTRKPWGMAQFRCPTSKWCSRAKAGSLHLSATNRAGSYLLKFNCPD